MQRQFRVLAAAALLAVTLSGCGGCRLVCNPAAL